MGRGEKGKGGTRQRMGLDTRPRGHGPDSCGTGAEVRASCLDALPPSPVGSVAVPRHPREGSGAAAGSAGQPPLSEEPSRYRPPAAVLPQAPPPPLQRGRRLSAIPAAGFIGTKSGTARPAPSTGAGGAGLQAQAGPNPAAAKLLLPSQGSTEPAGRPAVTPRCPAPGEQPGTGNQSSPVWTDHRVRLQSSSLTRDSSSSSRRYLFSIACVRFSSWADTTSNSSSTAGGRRGRDVVWGLGRQRELSLRAGTNGPRAPSSTGSSRKHPEEPLDTGSPVPQ